MAVGFAGNSSSMERRRRLMSTEELTTSDSILSEFGVRFSPDISELKAYTGSDQQLLGRLISRRIWKHVLILAALFLLLLIPALPLERIRELFAGDANRQHETRRMIDGLTGILLLLSGQLSVVIFAVRSHSAIDFRGRYRTWSWLAVLLMLTAGVLITGMSPRIIDFATLLLQPLIGTLQAARHAVVLVPGVAIGAIVVSLIAADMRRCRISQVTFLVAVLLSIAGFGFRTGRGGELVSARLSDLLLLWSSGLVFSSCLLHCRFVVHINNDPPIRKTGASDSRITESDSLSKNSAEQICGLADTCTDIPDTDSKDAAGLQSEHQPPLESNPVVPAAELDRRSRKKQKQQQRRAG